MNILNRIKRGDDAPPEPAPTRRGPNTLIKNAIKEADANDAGGKSPSAADAGEGTAEEKRPKPA